MPLAILASLCCSFVRHEIEEGIENSEIDSKLNKQEPIETFMNKVLENRIKLRILHIIRCMLIPRNDVLIKNVLKFIPEANSLRSSTEYHAANTPYIKAEKIYASIQNTYNTWKKKKNGSTFEQFFLEKVCEKKLYDISIEICAKIMSIFFARDISAKKNRYNMQTVNYWIQQKGYKNLLELQIVLVNTMIPNIIREINNNITD